MIPASRLIAAVVVGCVHLCAQPASAATGDAAAPPRRVPTHLACVGDSITAGVGASSFLTTYPKDLGNLLGAGTQVVAFGHSGATMLSNSQPPTVPYETQPEYTAATTFVANAGAASIVDVIIMLGTNDAQPQNWSTDGGDSAAHYAADYNAMIDHFTALGTHPVLYSVFPPTSYTAGVSESVIHDQIIPIIKQIAAAKGLPVIDVNTATSGHREYFGTDGLHPDDEGHQVIAQTMYDAILGTPIPDHDGGTMKPEAGINSTDAGRAGAGGSVRVDAGGAGAPSGGAAGGAAGMKQDANGAGGSMSVGASGSSEAASSADTSTTSDGCSCRVATDRTPLAAAPFFAAAVGAMFARRRRRA